MAAQNFLGGGLSGLGDGLEQPMLTVPVAQPLTDAQRQLYGLFRSRSVDANAAAKANRLLTKFLTPEQLAEYKATDRFTVINGKRKYTIGRDALVRVYDIDDYRLAPPRETWCVRLPGTPISDSILAQLLLLRDNPGKLRKMACVISGRRGGAYARAQALLQRAEYVG